MKRFLWSSFLVILLLGVLPAATPAAAGGSWSAWVYNPESGELVHVFPDGAAATSLTFPLPPGTSRYPYQVAISRDGSLLAACLIDDADNPSVRVYDIYGGSYIAAFIPLGSIDGCSLTRYGFSEDGTSLAFGILNYQFDSGGDPRPDWEVIVMQMHTSAILARISIDSPQVTAFGLDFRGMLPFVAIHETPLVAFYPVRWGTEGAAEYDSLVWNTATGDVNLAGPYGKSSLDFDLPNGEAIWVTELDSLPKGTLEGPGYLFNAVQYGSKATTGYTIFANPGAVLNQARFIDGGRRVAVHSYTYPSTEVWMSVDRSGAVSLLPSDVQTYDLWGTPDGYVFTDTHSGPTTQVRYHRFVAGSTVPESYVAWSAPPGGYWQIVWVNPLTESGLAAFAPYGVLGEPPVAVTLLPPAVITLPPPAVITLPPGVVITPVAPGVMTLPPGVVITSVAPGVMTLPPPAVITLPAPVALHVGGQARTHTTEGDQLRVRNGVGTVFGVAFSLPDGTLVTIADGPATADGFTWWFIRTADGRTGWAVESVVDNGALLQTLVPVS